MVLKPVLHLSPLGRVTQMLKVIFIIGCHTFQALDATLFVLWHVPVRSQRAIASFGRSVDPLQAVLQLRQTVRSPPVDLINESLQVFARRFGPAHKRPWPSRIWRPPHAVVPIVQRLTIKLLNSAFR